MNILFYDIILLIIFCLVVGVFLYIERKKLVKDGIMYLYKTKIGLEVIDKIAKKYPRGLNFLSYIIVFTGYVLMISALILIFQLLQVFTNPQLVKMIKIPPIMPLIPYMDRIFKIEWLPNIYFSQLLIILALIAIFHEGFHGIYARLYGVKIKSTGFGFLGPLLAFFVEQDNKDMDKIKPFRQQAMLAAGVFANILLAIIFAIVMALFFKAAYVQNGLIYSDYSYNYTTVGQLENAKITSEIINVGGLNFTRIELGGTSYLLTNNYFNLTKTSSEQVVKIYFDMPAIRANLKGAIVSINGRTVNTQGDLAEIMSTYKPGDEIKLGTVFEENGTKQNIEYKIKVIASPDNSTKAIIGISSINLKSYTGFKGMMIKVMGWFKDPNTNYEPKSNPELTKFTYDLFWWLWMINFSVAIANMLPLGIFDGGRFFYLGVLMVTKKKKLAENAFKYMTWLLLGVLAITMILWAVNSFIF